MIKHKILMIVCCLVPIIIAGALYYLGFKTYALLAIMLLCPILHYFMMRDMHKNNVKTGKCH